MNALRAALAVLLSTLPAAHAGAVSLEAAFLQARAAFQSAGGAGHDRHHAPQGRPVLPSPPQVPEQVPVEGPAAAMAFERATRGVSVNPNSTRMPYSTDPSRMRYPDSQPAAVTGLRNIVPMTPELWTPAQLLADFQKNRTPEQVGVIVFMKTEYCHQNMFRGCAVATAALEKRSTPLLRRFRVYGAWIEYLNPDRKAKGEDYGDWLDQAADFYAFQQGPGSNLFILLPGDAAPRLRSDAQRLGLSLAEFERDQGRTPALEAWLQAVLKTAKAAAPAK